jgi:hypothetical protein
MERNEQKHAQELYESLTSRFATLNGQVRIDMNGGGVQWRCSAERGSRSCWIGCFEASGPEFLTSFEEGARKVAIGRSSSDTETVDAVWHWLNANPLPTLYDRFRFVDWEKRKLMSISECMTKNFPNLSSGVESDLTVTGSGVSHLWYRTESRAAHILFTSRSENPDAAFYWDDCELFRFNAADCNALGAVLSRWLGGNAAPSSLRSEFPWLQIGRLADYYETGRPVEGEFLESWDRMEQIYEGSHFPSRTRILPFIADLRKAGYDRKLRAGQSIWSLIVSRSRRPRVRPEQPLVSFQFHEDTMELFSSNDGEERIPVIPIELSGTVQRALERLVERPID